MAADTTYRGEVTRIDPEGVWVRVPKLGGRAVAYGPLQVLQPTYFVGNASVGTELHDHGLHSHGLISNLQVGTRVLLSTVNGIPEDLVVLGILA